MKEKIKELENRIEQLEKQNEKNKTYFTLTNIQIELLTTALKKIDAYLDMISAERK